MKSLYVNIILVIAVIAALYLFYLNTRNPTDIDRLRHNMVVMAKYMKPNTTIGLMTPSRDLELETKLQYVLATIPSDYGIKDTTLFLSPIHNTPDSVFLFMLKSRAVIFECSDNQYHYWLTRAH